VMIWNLHALKEMPELSRMPSSSDIWSACHEVLGMSLFVQMSHKHRNRQAFSPLYVYEMSDATQRLSHHMSEHSGMLQRRLVRHTICSVWDMICSVCFRQSGSALHSVTLCNVLPKSFCWQWWTIRSWITSTPRLNATFCVPYSQLQRNKESIHKCQRNVASVWQIPYSTQ
jgi:hypothetical protein